MVTQSSNLRQLALTADSWSRPIGSRSVGGWRGNSIQFSCTLGPMHWSRWCTLSCRRQTCAMAKGSSSGFGCKSRNNSGGAPCDNVGLAFLYLHFPYKDTPASVLLFSCLPENLPASTVSLSGQSQMEGVWHVKLCRSTSVVQSYPTESAEASQQSKTNFGTG